MNRYDKPPTYLKISRGEMMTLLKSKKLVCLEERLFVMAVFLTEEKPHRGELGEKASFNTN